MKASKLVLIPKFLQQQSRYFLKRKWKWGNEEHLIQVEMFFFFFLNEQQFWAIS